MVNSCCAYGCTNRYKKKSQNDSEEHVQFHRFPLKDPNKLKLWVNAVRRINWQPAVYSFICSKHFIESDYQIRPGADRKYLNERAVPSVFDKFPPHLIKEKEERRLLVTRVAKADMETAENDTVTEPSTSANLINSLSNTQDQAIQCKIKSSTTDKLQRKIKILRQRMTRRDNKIESLEALLRMLKSKVRKNDEAESVRRNNFSGLPLDFILHQLDNKHSKKGALRYSNEMKNFAKALYFCSPKAYNLVRMHFILPHPTTINWENNSPNLICST